MTACVICNNRIQLIEDPTRGNGYDHLGLCERCYNQRGIYEEFCDNLLEDDFLDCDDE